MKQEDKRRIVRNLLKGCTEGNSKLLICEKLAAIDNQGHHLLYAYKINTTAFNFDGIAKEQPQ